jgi:hypothetical protein
MRERCLRNSLCVLALLANSCRGEPAPSVAPATSLSASEPTRAAATNSATPAPSGSASAVASPSAAPPSAGETEEPALLAADGAPLPQTEARPSATDERFKRRMRHLADAIRLGDTQNAHTSFFPLVAYAQVKDVAKPERDYRYRLLSNFERDVREYRKALGRDAEHAELVGVEVPEARVEWIKPGKEGNRLGYFRVLRSRLRFRLQDGKERSFELTSLISWRGEWYVVHLHGFE